MKIDELINEIENFKITSEPIKIKIILGLNGYNPIGNVEKNCEKTKIQIYRDFGEVAFIMEDFKFKPSEIFILGILLGNVNVASEFLKTIGKKPRLYFKFIEFLYYKHGIVLINRKGNIKLLKKLDFNKISDILIVGKNIAKTFIDEIGKFPKILVSKCLHCSPTNMCLYENYFNVWFLHEDEYLENVNKINSNTKFSNFLII